MNGISVRRAGRITDWKILCRVGAKRHIMCSIGLMGRGLMGRDATGRGRERGVQHKESEMGYADVALA